MMTLRETLYAAMARAPYRQYLDDPDVKRAIEALEDRESAITNRIIQEATRLVRNDLASFDLSEITDFLEELGMRRSIEVVVRTMDGSEHMLVGPDAQRVLDLLSTD